MGHFFKENTASFNNCTIQPQICWDEQRFSSTSSPSVISHNFVPGFDKSQIHWIKFSLHQPSSEFTLIFHTFFLPQARLTEISLNETRGADSDFCRRPGLFHENKSHQTSLWDKKGNCKRSTCWAVLWSCRGISDKWWTTGTPREVLGDREHERNRKFPCRETHHPLSSSW